MANSPRQPDADDPNDFGEYDIAPPEQKFTSVRVPLTEPPPPAPGAAPTLAYRAPIDERPPSSEPETIKNLYMPLWLLGGGIVIEVVAAFIRTRDPRLALTYVGVNVVVSTVIMLAGMLLAARFRGIDLGRFWIAAFKLAAISIAPGAVVTLFTPLLNAIPFGGLLGWLVTFVLYFALLGALFDLDQEDTWYCVCVIFLIRLAAYFAILWLR
jgi:hypothetical protein